jgi:hypothetical protein
MPLRAYVWQQDFCLGFYEVYTGIQTLAFQPNRHVNISAFQKVKNDAIMAYESQSPQPMVDLHDKMSAYRGLEIGVPHAEAFCILGGQTRTLFDDLFNDRIVYQDSGGKSLPEQNESGAAK